ncbi:MAG: hypothetical protein HY894_10200 [Deltaproteobacteria bacterium]|nr:hypothetical protein [Deltaproteobacteria bacterium]
MKVKIEVGEPRGFDAGDGTNVIIGAVDEAVSGQQEVEVQARAATLVNAAAGENPVEKLVEYWFVANCPQVDFKGMRFKSILFTPRYKAKKPPVETLAEPGQAIVVNGIWRKDGEAWTKTAIADAQEGRLEIDGMIVAKVTMVAE